jgi:hypothetical protein
VNTRFAIACIVSLGVALAVACDDNGSTSTGSGGWNTTLSLAPGAYDVEFTAVDCGSLTPVATSLNNVQFCLVESLENFLGLPCAIKRTGNALSISCDVTREVYASCFETTRIRAEGTASPGSYELSGTIEVNDSPLACADSIYCWAFDLTIDRTGAASTACQYADINTVALTIENGPIAGPRTLVASGTSGGSPGSYSFNFSANDSRPVPATSTDAPNVLDSFASMFVQIPALDPASLPVDLPITAIAPRTEASEPFPGAGASLYYSESYDDAPDHYVFYAESATSGNLRVEEIDADHVAGTLTVIMDGTAYGGPAPGPTTRVIHAGFFVTSSNIAGNATRASGYFTSRLRDLLTTR